MTIITATRRLGWDAGHRVTRHGGKCQNLHGHSYVAEITVQGAVPEDGMILDFGLVKSIVGAWIDEHWDHGVLLEETEDAALVALCQAQDWKVFPFPAEPTAENIAAALLVVAEELLAEHQIRVAHVRVYETPNCWADARPTAPKPQAGYREGDQS